MLAETAGAGAAALDTVTLDAVVDQAIAALAATGLDAAQVDSLQRVEFSIEDLGGRVLGLAGSNRILIDDDAAGHGWSQLDTSSDDDPAYAGGGSVDLLSVVLHELGHTLGYGDEDPRVNPDSLMAGVLAPGEHREADSLFIGDDLFNLFD